MKGANKRMHSIPVRNDNPKTRKPLHLPIQGLLSLKTATTYSPTVTQYHRRD